MLSLHLLLPGNITLCCGYKIGCHCGVAYGRVSESSWREGVMGGSQVQSERKRERHLEAQLEAAIFGSDGGKGASRHGDTKLYEEGGKRSDVARQLFNEIDQNGV